MSIVVRLEGREILDSRGRPTVAASCELAGGVCGAASVPSGASTGAAEAWELRDGDPTRYRGLGCRRAVANICGEIDAALRTNSFRSQREFDDALIRLDGSANKSRLGANALLAASLAFARAQAAEAGLPLYRHLATLTGRTIERLPRLTVNLFSGGKHAGAQVAIQDVLLVPSAAQSVDEGLATVWAVFQSAAELTAKKYGVRALRADEGGLAPPFPSTETMLSDAVEAIASAGFSPGPDVALAVDVASSHFFVDGRYHIDNRSLDCEQMVQLLDRWTSAYPIVSLEDGLHEEAWDDWPKLRERLSSRALVMGDDFLCTNPARIDRAVHRQTANALLLKVNQIGTLSEAADAVRLARDAGWQVTASARSGETEDDWLADLAVGWGADQIKVGSVTQSERLAKYNRLLAIEAETNWPVNPWPNH